jgi:UDP-glucose 4-epimerase
LVTGGAGFIGSHLSAALLDRGHTVRIVDDLSTGMIQNVPAGAEFVRGDLTDPATASAAVQGCEFVFHQAAIASVPLSISEPRVSHDANINATFNVLMASRDFGVRRLVFAASSAVYGDDPILPKAEDMPSNLQSPYALHKQVGEDYCRQFHRLYGLETVSVRYFGRSVPVHQGCACGSGGNYLRRWRADPRLHLHRQRRRWCAPVHGCGRCRRRGHQRRDRSSDVPESSVDHIG